MNAAADLCLACPKLCSFACPVSEVTLLLVAHDGEWTRRRVQSVAWAHDFANRLGLPSYDAAVVGIPQRMRAYNRRQKEAKAPKYKASCKRSKSKRAIVCTVSSSSKATFRGTMRLQYKKKTATASKASKSGKVKLTLRSRKAFKQGQKVVVTVKRGKTTRVLTAKAR